ncbi:hypothetical protein K5V21_06085 [Clostridium sardiniense]|uniref:Phage protein n=1 Tax=Clostridium sardiniense TaxID=29369 RepID=A0ABS7KW32_CLOSR|nr:hypothetical protein [Clostridium sardiniense]MBY0755023.1 hypothetical protein [Clostridium sardiniense]MDQ0459123.1 hypothetical protein [Clostridium sardiniense]
MLDLDLINNSKMDIKINGEMVKVNEATYSIAKRVRAFQEYVASEGVVEEKSEKIQAELILDFLNNNENGKKFTQKDLDSFSFLGIKAVYNLMIDSISKKEINPNLESPYQEEK